MLPTRAMSLPVLLLAIFTFCAPGASATEWLVPDDFATIQDAIDASIDGDSVMVRPGVYVENIDFLGKAIAVTSADGPSATTIEAAVSGSVVVFRTGEPRESVLHGFTIRGGTGTCVLEDIPTIGVYGGGIFVLSSSPTISGNIIEENGTTTPCIGTLGTGGGIGIAGLGANPLVIDNRIERNHVNSSEVNHGGGIALRTDAAAEMYRNVIADNLASDGREAFGGGLYCYRDSVPEFSENRVVRNSANQGGGIALFRSAGNIRGNRIRANVAGLWGGGIRAFSCETTIESNEIRENEAERGAGLFAANNTGVEFRFNELTENVATSEGGGAAIATGETHLVSNLFLRNRAVRGAGLFLDEEGGTATFANNVVAFNEADQAGGGIFLAGTDIDLVNHTIFGNTADQRGGGIEVRFSSSNCSLHNSIVWANDATFGPAIRDVGPLLVVACDVEGGHAGDDNFDADPQLVAPYSRDDFRLRLGSPCVDRGSDSAPDLPMIDFEEDERRLDGDLDEVVTVDVGADEAAPDTAALFGAVNAGVGDISDVLLLNGSPGDDRRRLSVGTGEEIRGSMLLPPAAGRGKYVVHVNAGAPTPSTVVRMPGGVGWIGFDLRLASGAMPLAIFNGIGKTQAIGESVDFDGNPIPDPPPAPSVFLDLPFGDAMHLPVGTVVTFQGGILDPGTAGNKPASVTNGIVLTVE